MGWQAILGAAAGIGGALLNSGGQARQNRLSREFALKMYNRQVQDAYRFWQAENEYNSPREQMNRFMEAGLNPNLIYGQQNTGGNISLPSVQTPEFRNPRYGDVVTDSFSVLNSMYDLDIKENQAANLNAQNALIHQDVILRAAQTENILSGTERSKFDLGVEKELRDVSIQARQESLRQLKQSIDLATRKDAREAVMNASNVEEAAERMLMMQQNRAQSKEEIRRIRATVQNLKRDGVLKDFDIALRKQGLNPNDPTWMRIVATQLQQWIDSGKPFPYEEDIKRGAKSLFFESLPKSPFGF